MSTYFVANAGSDAANGTSSSTPFKTIVKLNSVLVPGDTALFNRGDTWSTITDASPAMHSNCTYGAYGAAPVLEGSGFSIPMPAGQPPLQVNDWVTNAPVFDAGQFVTGWTSYTGGVSDDYVSDNFSSVTAGADLSTSVPQIRATSDVWTEMTDVGGGHAIATAAGTIRRANTTGKSWYWLRGGPGQPAYYDYYVQATIKVASILTTDFAGVLARVSPSALGDSYNVEAYVDRNGNLTLAENTNNVQTVLGTSTTTLTVGGSVTLMLVVQGPTASLYVNGTLAIGPVGFGNTTEGQFSLAGGAVGILLGSASSTNQTDTTGLQVSSFVAGPLNDQTTPTVTTYQAPLASDAGLYAIRGTICEPGQGPNILQNNQYAWLNGIVYIATTGGAPGATDVVGGAATNVISGGATNNVTLGGLTLRHSTGSAVNWGTAPTALTLNGLQIELAGSQILANSNWGALNANGTNGLTVENCVWRNIGTDAARLNACPGHTFNQNRFGPMVGNAANCVIHTGTLTATINGAYTSNYSTYLNQNFSAKGHYLPEGVGFTFQHNYAEGGNFGVALIGGAAAPTSSLIAITGNMFYDIGILNAGPGGAIRLVDNATTSYTGVSITRNLIMECFAGIVTGSQGAGTRGVTVENNTIINVAVAPQGLNPAMLEGGAGYQVNFLSPTYGTFKNNVLWNASGSGKALLLASVAGGQTWVSDYNLIGPDATGNISYAGTAFNTLAAYVASKSQDAHSITSDPKFSNQTGPKNASSFALTYRSPARNVGIAATVTADSWGTPDMGATEYVIGHWGVPA